MAQLPLDGGPSPPRLPAPDDVPWMMPAGRSRPWRKGWRDGFSGELGGNRWKRARERWQYNEGFIAGGYAWGAWFAAQRSNAHAAPAKP